MQRGTGRERFMVQRKGYEMVRWAAMLALVALTLVSCGRAAAPVPTEAIQRTVTIDADVDGTRVDPVRLWAHPVNRDRMVAQLHHGDRVGLIRTEGESSLVRTSTGVDGWLLSAFIRELR